MRAFVVVASGLLLAAPTFAQTTEITTGSGASIATGQSELPEGSVNGGTDENGERRICRRVETASGSRMSYRRVCLTAEQWRNFNRQR